MAEIEYTSDYTLSLPCKYDEKMSNNVYAYQTLPNPGQIAQYFDSINIKLSAYTSTNIGGQSISYAELSAPFYSVIKVGGLGRLNLDFGDSSIGNNNRIYCTLIVVKQDARIYVRDAYFFVKPLGLKKELLDITYFQVYGDDIKNPIRVAWTVEQQDSGILEVYQDNKIVYTKSVGTEREITIPANTFKEGETIFTVRTKKILFTTDTDSIVSGSTSNKKITLTSSAPILTEFEIYDLQATWKGSNLKGSTGHIEVWNNDLNNAKVIIADIPSQDFSSGKFSLPAKDIYSGRHTAKLTIYKNISGNVQTSSMQTTFVVNNKPYVKINALEPADVLRNYEKDIAISWDSFNQQTYNLKVFQDNVLKYESNGSTEKTLTLPPNTLNNGSASIVLTITTTLFGIVKQDTKTAVFQLYGGVKPPIVTTDAVNNTINKNNIVISWNVTDLQRYYRVEFEVVRIYNAQHLDTGIALDEGYCLDGDLLIIKEDSGMVRSTDTTYSSKMILLKNDTIRNIKVTIYNELKENNSGVYSGDIYVLYDIDTETVLTAYTEDDKIVINAKSNMQGLTHRLMRGTNDRYTEYKEIFTTTQKDFAFEDSNVKSNARYYYYVVSSDKSRSILSNVVTQIINIKGFLFTNIATGDAINLNLEVSVDFDTIDGKVVVEYLGKMTADIEQDERDYQQASYSCLVRVSDLSMINDLFKADKVSYRDGQGNAFICNLLNKKISYNDGIHGFVRLGFTMVENDSLKRFE